MLLPIRKKTHAIARREDRLQIVLQLVKRKVLVNHLRNLERRHHIHRDPRDYSQRTQSHHGSGKLLRRPRQRSHLSGPIHKLNPADRGRQIAIPNTRSMRPRLCRPDHRNMRQRSQIVHRKSLLIQPRSQRSIPNPCAYRYCPRGLIQSHLVQMNERNLIPHRIRDVIKRVLRPQRLGMLQARNQLLHLCPRGWLIQMRSLIRIICRPIRPRLLRRQQIIATHPSHYCTRQHSRRILHKLPLRHPSIPLNSPTCD